MRCSEAAIEAICGFLTSPPVFQLHDSCCLGRYTSLMITHQRPTTAPIYQKRERERERERPHSLADVFQRCGRAGFGRPRRDGLTKVRLRMERIHIEAACLLGFYASYWRLVPLTYILTMFAGPFRRSRPTTNGNHLFGWSRSSRMLG